MLTDSGGALRWNTAWSFDVWYEIKAQISGFKINFELVSNPKTAALGQQTFFLLPFLLLLLSSQVSASQWLCQSMVLDRCYMHFVTWHTGGAGHEEIYQHPPTPPRYYTTYRLLSRQPAHNALPWVDFKALPSGGGVWGWLVEEEGGVVLVEAALGERLIGRLIRQWRSEACRPRVGVPVSFLLLLWSLTNL